MHKADIYESILPKEQREGAQKAKERTGPNEAKDLNEIDQGPNMDEL